MAKRGRTDHDSLVDYLSCHDRHVEPRLDRIVQIKDDRCRKLARLVADPATGDVWEDRATVSRQTWDAIAVGEVRELWVVSGRPEVNSLFGGQGIARASRQLDTLASWLGGLSLACLVADRWLRRRARRAA